ncbi:MAG: MlaE family lipid ABC transporter permease subunit [Ectothiorhodospiraceae bacterium]|nr:MlaE family lipid ABC transporter permease subunit [Ectothiorhodospiraceae bacterium]
MTEHTSETPDKPGFTMDGTRLVCRGDWSAPQLAMVERRLQRLSGRAGDNWQLDTSGVSQLDSAGAFLLDRLKRDLEKQQVSLSMEALPSRHRALIDLIAETAQPGAAVGTARKGPLVRLGESTTEIGSQAAGYLDFVGRFALDSLPRLLTPHRIRWKQVVGEIEHAGVNAIPILGLLAFLTGVVIAYQGGTPLEQYGANILLVDLLAITMLREMAPLMTAIIVAGRTGSAYAAQIGTMRITEEVDALRVIGLTPYEILALPKMLGLLVAMPLLTLFADLMGMLGGMVVANTMFGIGYDDFLRRIPEAIYPSSFWVGIIKAPVFAAIIVSISCYHGFAVQGSTESVGRATTRSVVQSIFLVIVADAIFSVVFNIVNL